MNGELAQAAVLVAYARAALAGQAYALDLSNSTFKFVHALVFETEVHRWFGASGYAPVATTPAQWYESLARRKLRSISLVIQRGGGPLSDHVASAFAGGGSWVIGVAHEGGEELWRANWRADNGAAADRKIWSVAYRAVRSTAIPPQSNSVVAASAKLGEVLKKADLFAGETKLESWRKWFQAAQSTLATTARTSEDHSDLLPPTVYTAAARRLLSACDRAWVFGGMGSWNDLGFDEDALQRRYDALTDELFAAVLDGVVAAVNEKFPSAASRAPG